MSPSFQVSFDKIQLATNIHTEQLEVTVSVRKQVMNHCSKKIIIKNIQTDSINLINTDVMFMTSLFVLLVWTPADILWSNF